MKLPAGYSEQIMVRPESKRVMYHVDMTSIKVQMKTIKMDQEERKVSLLNLTIQSSQCLFWFIFTEPVLLFIMKEKQRIH